MPRNDHQRASVSTPINNFLYFFAYFICGMELPALWMIVTEKIYDLRESHNCPRTYDTYFTLWIALWLHSRRHEKILQVRGTKTSDNKDNGPIFSVA